MQTQLQSDIIFTKSLSNDLKTIAEKVVNNKRINNDECLLLFEKAGLGFLGILSNLVRERKNGNNTFFNRNFHVEPTNICKNHCKFCSYRRLEGQKGSWEYSIEDIENIAKKYINQPVTEVHIVGGVHPNRDLYYYGEMISRIKNILPKIHVKAFTAVELDFMIKKSGLSIEQGLKKIKEFGLDSIPGGGAEIFDEKIRKEICPDKTSSEQWLKIHETAHSLNIPTNATILYGHIENYSHRVDHMNRLRTLQDKTHGFNSFIPLKFRSENNKMSYLSEVSVVEDLKNYAISRIYLDNFDHIKAYWPMIGKDITQLSLSFGVDDIDGTIDDTTKIYSMAGAQDQNPTLSVNEIVKLIKEANRIPIERDTLYNTLKNY
ncbi:MAG: aminofutalosine synthase MqnE [Bacteroidales bacterium]|nr:aminofutalosine synthase MqnE [Bacteroidales bacterium]